MLDAADQLLRMKVEVERDDPLGDVLGEIADPLEIVATRMAPTISRRSTAIGCRRAMVRIAFSSISCCMRVDDGIGGDHMLGKIGVALD